MMMIVIVIIMMTVIRVMSGSFIKTFMAPESIMLPSILPTLDVIACKSMLK